MMGPESIVQHLMSVLDVHENCTNQLDKGFPSFSFTLADGMELTLNPADYMDQLVLSDGVYCWPHLMPMPETAKGHACVGVWAAPPFFLQCLVFYVSSMSEALGFSFVAGGVKIHLSI